MVVVAGAVNAVAIVVVPFPATVANAAPPQLVANSTVPRILVAVGKVTVSVPATPAQILFMVDDMLVGFSLLWLRSNIAEE